MVPSEEATGAVGPARAGDAGTLPRKEGGVMTKASAKGQTHVTTFKAVTYDEPKDGPKLNEVQLVETFTGEIEGKGRRGCCRRRAPMARCDTARSSV